MCHARYRALAAFEAQLMLQQSPLLRKLSNTSRRYKARLEGMLAPSEVKKCLVSMLCGGVVSDGKRGLLVQVL